MFDVCLYSQRRHLDGLGPRRNAGEAGCYKKLSVITLHDKMVYFTCAVNIRQLLEVSLMGREKRMGNEYGRKARM
jgi:hypothetical protein